METLARIYAEVPDAGCKGLCYRACGPIAMSQAEARAIVRKHGDLPAPIVGSLVCSKLVDGRCSIYADRPLICRLYGSTRELKCEHGCGPAGGFYPDRLARKLLHRVEALRT